MSAYFYQTIILPSSLYMEASVILFKCKLDCVCCPTAQNIAQYLYLGLRTYIPLSSFILYHSPRYHFQLFLKIHQVCSDFRAFLHVISFTNHWISLQIESFTSSNVPGEGFHDCSIYNAILFHYLIFF